MVEIAKTENANIGVKGIYLYKPQNTPYWQVRLTINKLTYPSRSTKIKDKDQAIEYSKDLFKKEMLKIELGFSPLGTSFRSLAAEVINDLKRSKRSEKSSKNYISIIKKFTEEFFKDINIELINNSKIRDYYEWRKLEYGELAKSTILKHNIALRKIFSKAEEKDKKLSVNYGNLLNDGSKGEGRSPISLNEFDLIVEHFYKKIKKTKNEKTKEDYDLLFDVMELLMASGVRAGDECLKIKWEDVSVSFDDGVPEVRITVKNGKNGIREISVRLFFIYTLHSLAKKFPDRKKDDYLFRRLSGKLVSQDSLSRKFSEAIKKLNLAENKVNKKTLYSLRKSYINWQIEADADVFMLSRHCGNSVDVIQKHYANKNIALGRKEFTGTSKPNDIKLNEYSNIRELTLSEKKRFKKVYGYLAKNCLERGFP